MVPGSIPGGATGFFVTYSFRPHYGPEVDSVPSENEYQEHFLEVKAAGALGWRPNATRRRKQVEDHPLQIYSMHENLCSENGKQRHALFTRVNNTKMDITKIGFGVDNIHWISLPQVPATGFCGHLNPRVVQIWIILWPAQFLKFSKKAVHQGVWG